MAQTCTSRLNPAAIMGGPARAPMKLSLPECPGSLSAHRIQIQKLPGEGLEQLRSAGIEVCCNVLGAECGELIAPFAKHMKTGLPYVVFKSAMTLDGQTATLEGDSKWISSEASRELVHQLRNQVDAIMVGSGTVIADNPRLNDHGWPRQGETLSGLSLTVDWRPHPTALVYSQSSSAQAVLITSSEHSVAALQPYREGGTDIVAVRQDRGMASI